MYKLKILQNKTCFEAHKELKLSCDSKSCKNWMNYKEDYNCSIISAQNGPKTLQEIGDIFGLTRMRICQIEKNIKKKILD